HPEAAGRVALAADVLAGGEVDHVGVLADPGQLILVEGLEEEEPAQGCWVQFRTFGRRHRFSNQRCTRLTAIAPSPTAEATRFTDPPRTSPTANTPGREVSRWN